MEVVLGAFKSPPFVSDCFLDYPRNCTHPGPGIEVELILTYLNILGYATRTVEIDPSAVPHEIIQNGSIDVVAFTTTLSGNFEQEFNSRQIAATVPVDEHPRVRLLIKKKRTDALATILIPIFQPKLWFLIASILLVFVIYRLVFCRTVAVKIFSPRRSKLDFYRLFDTGFALAFAIILSFYPNFLAIQFAKDSQELWAPATTIEGVLDKVRSKDCNFVTKELTLTYLKDKICPTTRDSLDENACIINRPQTVASSDQLVAKIREQEECNIGVEFHTAAKMLVAQNCELIRILDLNADMQYFQYVYVYRRNASFGKKLNYLFGQPEPAIAFYQMLLKRYEKPCNHSKLPAMADSFNGMALSKFVEIFYLLSAGIGAALLLFFCENMFARKQRTSIQRQRWKGNVHQRPHMHMDTTYWRRRATTS